MPAAPLDLPGLGLATAIGHRGAAASAPENTLAGIRRCAELGLAWVEFDVMLTGDDQPVLFHDDALGRTTNGHGPMAEAPLSHIRTLDAGSWFDAAFVGEPVPTLESALALCFSLGLRVNLEIKPSAGREAITARIVVAAAHALWPASQKPPLVIGFDMAALTVAREIAPEWPIGLCARRRLRNWQALTHRLGCSTLHLKHTMLNRRTIPKYKAAGLGLVAFTVNDPARAARLLSWGVDAVVSDRPEAIAAQVASQPAARVRSEDS